MDKNASLPLKARGAPLRPHAPRFYFILLKLCSPLGFFPRVDARRIKWHKKSQREKSSRTRAGSLRDKTLSSAKNKGRRSFPAPRASPYHNSSKKILFQPRAAAENTRLAPALKISLRTEKSVWKNYRIKLSKNKGRYFST